MLDSAMKQPDLTRLLCAGRVHEAMGLGNRVFAASLARALSGPVIWLITQQSRERLCPQGLVRFFDPARLILVSPPDRRALLQSMEEALRSGAAPLVTGETGRAPDLTESRRLQLAAAGGGRGLCLIADAMTNAAETRWHCSPRPGTETAQTWDLVKNKKGALGTWSLA
ncbi:MAG: hypothetical protein AAGE80_03250 [Pseudomonadota bacterium]